MALIQRSLPWMWWRRRTQESAGVDLSPAADPLFEAGLRLREHREQRGLSLRDLSREVRITTPVLEALERGWSDRLPEPAYLVAMLQRLEQYLDLEPESLNGALPEHCFQQQLPQDQRRTRFTLGSIDIFTTWQGSVVYGVVITVSLLALNQQQRQLAINNTKSFTPVALNLQKPEKKDASLPAPGLLELSLLKPSTITLSSASGDASTLRGVTGELKLQLLPPLELTVEPAPDAGTVQWNGRPQPPTEDASGTYRLDQTSARNP